MISPKVTGCLRFRLSTLLLLVIICAQGLALFISLHRQAYLETRLQAALKALHPRCIWELPTQEYKDRQNSLIRAALERPVNLSYADGTSLSDVVKQVKTLTDIGELHGGIPVYFDPVGFALSGTSETTPLKGHSTPDTAPLGKMLHQILEPIGLGYLVEDGVLVITSADVCWQRTKAR